MILKKFPLIVLLLTFASQDVVAHAEHDKARFVAEDGEDIGRCDNRFRPCATIRFAAMQANKGDSVLVAAGTYLFENATDAQILNDALMPVIGGFSRIDHFQIQNPSVYKTTLVNVPVYLTSDLYDNGFNVIVDAKGANGEHVAERKQHHTLSQRISANLSCNNGMAGEYPCNGVSLLSHVPVSVLSSLSSEANDIWGHVDLNTNKEYAIVGMQRSVAVVDVSDASNPVVVGEITGQSTVWRDIKVFQYFDDTAKRWRAYAYSTADSVSEGFSVIDLNNLPNDVTLVTRITDDNSAHNIYISNVDYAFNTPLNMATPQIHITGQNTNGGAFRSYSLATAQRPSATYIPTGLTRSDYTHDASSMLVTDSRAQTDCVNANASGCTVILDFNEGTMRLWDHTNPNSVTELSSAGYVDSAYTHSGWYSEDMQYTFVHDELDERNSSLNTRVMVFDVSSLTTPQLVSIWVSDNPTVDHNGYVRGDRYYMSNYERGLTILDISDPTAPVEAGFFDTYPAFNTSNFNGAWGVYPFLPSGNILVSDIQGGLYVLKDETLGNEPQVGFDVTQVITEADSVVTLTVNKQGSEAAEVSYEVIAGATDDNDVALSSGKLVWGANDTASQTISLTIGDNEAGEPTEKFFVRLFNANGVGITPGKGYALIAITGEAQPGSAELGVQTLTALEPAGSVSVNVSRQGGNDGTLTIDYALVSDTAMAGEDFIAQSGTLTWLDEDTTPKTITAELINDTDGETQESFTIELSAENADLLGNFTTTVINIKDDESNQAPIVNAGEDTSVNTRATQSLVGSASDPEGNLVSILWEQTSGTEVEIRNSGAFTARFTAPNEATTLIFSLSATDEFGVRSSDTVTVEVQAAPEETPDPDPVVLPTPPQNNDSSGGGSNTPWALFGLVVAIALRRQTKAQRNRVKPRY